MKGEDASPKPHNCEHGVNLEDDCLECYKKQYKKYVSKMQLIQLLAEKGLSENCKDRDYILSRIFDESSIALRT